MKGSGKYRREALNGEFLELVVELLEGQAELPEDEIYIGRNRITRLEIDGGEYAVKYFSRSLKNRLVYAVASSKAKRSYHHARELLRRGIDTPRPIGYCERRGAFNTLQKSLYMSEYEESEALGDYLSTSLDAWKEFAAFVAQLHRAGIIHKDLNNTNVRVKRRKKDEDDSGSAEFSLIDLNRMTILPEGEIVKGEKAYKNMVRFSKLTPEFPVFAKEYSRLMGLGEDGYRGVMEAKRKHEKL